MRAYPLEGRRHDAVTFVTIIDVGRSIHVDTTFKATTAFVASLAIR